MKQTKTNRVTYWIRQQQGTLRVLSASRRAHIHIYIDKKQKKLVIGERYERKIKFASRVFLFLSMITSVIAIPPPISIIVSLGLILLEQLFERVIYSFQTMHIVPFPSFDVWKKADFVAMLFARFGEEQPPNVSMVFTNPTYARDVWHFIEAWNYGNEDDRRTNNIRVSIVINNKASAYALFVYPDYDRPSVKASRRKFQKQGKEQQMLVGQMIMCKVFPLKDSGFERVFLPQYKTGEEYIFSCWVLGNPPDVVSGTMKIKKNDLRIIDYAYLTRKDLEYHMAKYRIDWYDSELHKPSMLYVRKD